MTVSSMPSASLLLLLLLWMVLFTGEAELPLDLKPLMYTSCRMPSADMLSVEHCNRFTCSVRQPVQYCDS